MNNEAVRLCIHAKGWTRFIINRIRRTNYLNENENIMSLSFEGCFSEKEPESINERQVL